MKTIVTHLSPDIDAIASVWLIHRYLPGWEEAAVELVSAGFTLNNMPPDKDKNILHVDTGMGTFDHHHTSDFTSATRLIFDDLRKKGHIGDDEAEAIERVVDVVTRYDHFKETELDSPDDDIHIFSVAYAVLGLRKDLRYGQHLIEISEEMLDGILQYMKGKVHAEHIIKKGHTCTTHWGKTLFVETDNDGATRAAQIKGFDLVVRYSPSYKNVSIKLHPRVRKTLKKLEKALVPGDTGAFWFYHASGHMLLNASTRDTRHMVTKYTLAEIVEIVKGIR